MAIRGEELHGPGARIYAFPVERARASRARAAARARRRTVAAGAVVAMALGALLATGPSGAASADAGRSRRRVVLVQPGDTLWGIAGRFRPAGADPRAYVDALADINDVVGPLQAGTRLRLPK